MLPDDLALLRTPGTPALAPDGRIAVVAVTRPDLAADAPRSQLWAVPTDGSAPARPLTSGGRDTAPAFSPDGRWLAYLGAAGDEPLQVHLLPAAGGAPRRLTDARQGAGSPVWAPDSRRLAWTAPRADAAEAGGPRLVTALRQLTGPGPLGGPVAQVHVLDLPDDLAADDVALPRPVVVTHGEADCTDVCWSPDGSELAFVSARHATADRDLRTDVFAVRPDGSGLRRVTATRGRCRTPAWSPSGDALVLTWVGDLGPDGLDDTGRPAALCRVPSSGGTPEPLLAADRGDALPGAVVTGRGVLVRVRRQGAVELLRVPPAGGEPEVLVDGPFTVRGAGAGAGVVVATVAHDGSAGELVAITPGRRRLLTGFGTALAATGRVHRSVAVPVPDRETPAWAALPAGPGPHPVLLDLAADRPGWSLRDDVQLAVSAGLAVVLCAPGDAGAVLDAALADPALRLDGARVGVVGGTPALELAARTGRFAAAVLEAAYPALDDAAPGDAVPHAAAPPTLVVSGSPDARAPEARVFAALKRAGVPAELLVLPGGGPDPARSDRPRTRIARAEHQLRWWRRWLAPGGDRAPRDRDG
ncbi:S9 family peptidase [Trujillonella humicola]|uniref:S9 family peptidase n=1 Tax=Trujillonella humicola TaxID=3383699 RepID=UPI003905B6B9